MDSTEDNGESKAALRPCAPRSLLLRCLVGFPTVVCFMLSLSSIAICLLMSFKTYQLENRLDVLELEKNTVFNPPESAFTREDGTVLPALRSSIETLLQERLSEVMPKLRTARDVPQECSCPPGPPGKRGRMGRRGDPVVVAVKTESRSPRSWMRTMLTHSWITDDCYEKSRLFTVKETRPDLLELQGRGRTLRLPRHLLTFDPQR
ncbi:collagen alpha-1(XXV) chain-like [Oncorhynchus masou masou]|uniref:collagen alpha-1(XXV) chain-like n=1 Tax=Oncorhynchus masou masou TaxID=90313 RepID=UPI0031832366